MRDPQGTLTFSATEVVRHLHSPLAPGSFLRSGLAQTLVSEGVVVPFRIEDPVTVVADRLPFVSHPTEWCDAQLFAAGKFTLALQARVVAAGYELKDASAWNVLFQGERAVFCDLLSFEQLSRRTWWSAGQYARHFILPLLVSSRRGLRSSDVFRVWRDGLPPKVGRELLGASRFLSRYWPLMAEARSARAEQAGSEEAPANLDHVQRYRARLQASLEWMLDGVGPASVRPRASDWASYTAERRHYEAVELDSKRLFVSQALQISKPIWVADLGCNTGEFSLLARSMGARVIAIDTDHESVQMLYQRHQQDEWLFPVLAGIDDLIGGRGWKGSEFPGLHQRMEKQVDLVMMLAVVHHLAVAAAVPLKNIAELASSWTRRWLIVEWVSPEDSQMQSLCSQRRRNPDEFTVDTQRKAFIDAGFEVVQEQNLATGRRVMALLRLTT